MNDYGDVFGRDVDAVTIVREWLDDGGEDFEGWLIIQWRNLWGEDLDAESVDWGEVARSIERDALHGEWTIDDVAAGWAQVVRCPDCGQMEIWCEAEISDHGLCRAARLPCPICAEEAGQ